MGRRCLGTKRRIASSSRKRGVEILIVSYGDLVFDFAQVHQHDASEEVTK